MQDCFLFCSFWGRHQGPTARGPPPPHIIGPFAGSPSHNNLVTNKRDKDLQLEKLVKLPALIQTLFANMATSDLESVLVACTTEEDETNGIEMTGLCLGTLNLQ